MVIRFVVSVCVCLFVCLFVCLLLQFMQALTCKVYFDLQVHLTNLQVKFDIKVIGSRSRLQEQKCIRWRCVSTERQSSLRYLLSTRIFYYVRFTVHAAMCRRSWRWDARIQLASWQSRISREITYYSIRQAYASRKEAAGKSKSPVFY